MHRPVCKNLSSPAGSAELFLQSSSCLTTRPPHCHRHSTCVFSRDDAHIWMGGGCCVFKLFIEHLQQRSGPQRWARAASWKELRCLLSVLCEPRKTVSRGGLQERPSVATPPVCLRLLFQVPSKLCCWARHICQHLGAQTVFGFSRNWARCDTSHKTHTVRAQPEERSAVAPPRGPLSPQHTKAHTHSCIKIHT